MIRRMTTKKEYNYRIENKLCTQCGGVRVDNKNMCTVCIAKIADKYKRSKLSGKCQNCKSPAERGTTKCDLCSEKQKARAKEKALSRRETKKCIRCGKTTEKLNCGECLLFIKKQRDERKQKGLCQNCGEIANGKSRCKKCNDINKASRDKLKLEVFTAYGGLSCSCCGDTHIEFLSLDHINNDGAVHRSKINNVYRSLRKNGYPPGYQVLCCNCNWAKYAYGECPHKKESNAKPN